VGTLFLISRVVRRSRRFRATGVPRVRQLGVITTLCHRVIDFVIPPRCAGCDAPVRHPRLWCTECADSVALLSQQPIPSTEQGYRVISPFVYGGPVANAVHRFKYSNRPELARALAVPVAERLLLANLPTFVLVPVPSTPERIVERGYNQSALLSAALGSLTGCPSLPLALRRVHFAPHQVGADKAHRRQHVAGAFAVNTPRIEGKPVVLVDDVITTGATSAACASALEGVGAKVFAIAAIARVP
jgi:ComF family protein